MKGFYQWYRKHITGAIFAGLILGILTGLFLADKFEVVLTATSALGSIYMNALNMMIFPLVFCSIVMGIASIGSAKTTGKITGAAMLFFLCTTALASFMGLIIPRLIHLGRGVKFEMATSDIQATKMDSILDTVKSLIPSNPVKAFAEGNMLQIIFFAIFVGILLAKRGERSAAVAQFFSQFNDLMMDMTMAVMKAAPIGVFCLIAKTFAGIGFDAFLPMLKYMAAVFLALMLQGFGVYQILLKLLTGLNPIKFIKKFFPVMAFAFSTATSNATIPLSIETLDKKMGVSKRISSFTIPLGATINMDGTAIMQGVAVVFVSQAFGIPLTLTDYLTVIATATIASIGTAGVPSVGLITLSMVFTSVGLPVEGIALIMGIDRILDMTRTAVNITGDAVCTTIIAHQNKELRREVYERMEQKGE